MNAAGLATMTAILFPGVVSQGAFVSFLSAIPEVQARELIAPPREGDLHPVESPRPQGEERIPTRNANGERWEEKLIPDRFNAVTCSAGSNGNDGADGTGAASEGPLANSEEAFLQKLEKTDPKDAPALLELGGWCEENGKLLWAAKCYRMAAEAGTGPAVQDATFRLARIELARKDYHRAYNRLRDLVNKHGHAGARSILDKASTRATRQQRKYLEEADEHFKKKQHGAARGLYAKAYDLIPEGESEADFVSASEVLEQVARCVDLIDDEYYKEKVLPFERSIKPCSKGCGKVGGFEKCGECDGKGTVRKRVVIGRRVVFREVACGRCNRFGWHLCSQCGGIQYDLGLLTKDERKVIRDVINKVRNLRILKRPLPKAIEEIEKVVLDVDHSTALNFFRSIKANYSVSKELRDAIGSVPPPASALKQAEAAWDQARDLRTRSNFLSSYAVDFTHHIRSYDMLRGLRGKLEPRSLPSASDPREDPVRPAVLSAFPEEGTRGWSVVQGILRGTSEDPGEPSKARLEIQGEVEHNVNFFVWRPAAKPHLEYLEKGPWRLRLSGLTSAYPFSLQDKAREAPTGNRVTLTGRFLRDRLGYPRNWFEVWDFEVGLSPSQEEILGRLEEPVDLGFEHVELRRLTGVLGWFGIGVVFKGVDPNTGLSCEASECPAGVLVDAVARVLDVPWYFKDGRAFLGSEGTGEEAKDTAAVVGHLAKASRGSISVRRATKGPAPAEIAGGPRLPDDPEALEARATKSAEQMDYLDAARCLGRLAEQSRDDARKSEFARRQAKAQLFHALTRSTPVSRLTDAKDLSRIVYRSPSGEELEQTVGVLAREDGALLIQPSYGGRIRIQTSRILKDERIGPAEWRQRKQAELEAAQGEVASAPPKDRVNKLFLLALFAKTNRFAERGTGFLDKALADARFGWLLDTYFPEEQRTLRQYWRDATRKASAGPAAKKPEDVASKPAAKKTIPLPEFVEEPLPITADDLLPFARDHYLKGRQCLSRSLPGMDNFQGWKKLALKHFVLAGEALDKLLSLRPGDETAMNLRPEVAMMIQTCVRDMGFFE